LNLAETPTQHQAQVVHNYSQQMLNMVMNMLDVQRFEEANMHLDQQEISINFLAGEACRQVEFMLTQKNIQILQDIPQNLYSLADVEILNRVFVNLLTNAIKYSPQNSQINLIAKQQETHLICQIEDEGKGIPADKVAYIFQKFTRLEVDTRKKYGATGLGLTFCKMAIEAHKGNIGVTNRAGKGATFWFSLPVAYLKETLPAHIPPNDKTVPEMPSTPKTILSAQSMAILRPFLPELSKLEVYYVSELEEILSKINFSASEDLQIWGKELKTAIHNFNQDQYQYLLAQIV
jgi:anti-sigma regulatory factor (Ser/Thr protein kinase)